MKDTRTEHGEQVALIQWRDLFGLRQFPELGLLFAIPNGGKRDATVARKLRAEGVLPGVSDLFLPVARHGFYGLFIEMKRPAGGRLSGEQASFQARVREQNYFAVVCPGADAAIAALQWYMLDSKVSPNQK